MGERILRRNLKALVGKEYDLIIVGGGIFGVCAAWDGVLQGLSVALVERGDFAHATSANCFKIVHGGARYLQHADLVRIRQSSNERNALLRIAPHLVDPLPIVIPTYGHGMKGKEILGLGLLLYDLVAFDRNRGLKDKAKRIPGVRFISRQETISRFPGLKEQGLTGAAIIHDGQMYDPARLALSFLRSAAEAGAEVANYVEVTGFLRAGSRVCGVKVRDRLGQEELEIRGKVVLNAAGPWAESLLGRYLGLKLNPEGTFSRDAFFIVSRPLIGEYALAVPGRTKDPDAILSRQARHLFIVPWKDCTLIGVWHIVHKGHPDQVSVTEEDLERFLDEINEAYPALGLTLDDISNWNAGLVLFGENKSGAADLSYGKRSRLIDHEKEHKIQGLITLIGVRYTTARCEAARTIDLVFKKLGRRAPKSLTAVTPIYGGRTECFSDFLRGIIDHAGNGLSAGVLRNLARNHGTEYRSVLKYVDENSIWAESVGESNVIKAEVIHAVREEMAQTLGDVVFRRTDLGARGFPGDSALRACAELMASERGWSKDRTKSELEEVRSEFPLCRSGDRRGAIDCAPNPGS